MGLRGEGKENIRKIFVPEPGVHAYNLCGCEGKGGGRKKKKGGRGEEERSEFAFTDAEGDGPGTNEVSYGEHRIRGKRQSARIHEATLIVVLLEGVLEEKKKGGGKKGRIYLRLREKK